MNCKHCNDTGEVFLPDYRIRCECAAGHAMNALEREVYGLPSHRVVPRWEERRAEYLRELGRPQDTETPKKPPIVSNRQYVKSQVWDLRVQKQPA